MPELFDSSTSSAWKKAALLALESRKNEINNLIVNIDLTDSSMVLEDPAFRSALDAALVDNGDFGTGTVINTLFPASLYRSTESRDQFYGRYLSLWPRITQCRHNRRGTYFQRLINYPSPTQPALNQLEQVIEIHKKGTRRRSAFQCSILDPRVDLNATPYQGFPCLQQLSFHPDRNFLRVAALYPMQYLWARAYGNYLGLIHLGRFMAGAMNLKLASMTCIAVVAKLERPKLAKRLLETGNA